MPSETPADAEKAFREDLRQRYFANGLDPDLSTDARAMLDEAVCLFEARWQVQEEALSQAKAELEDERQKSYAHAATQSLLIRQAEREAANLLDEARVRLTESATFIREVGAENERLAGTAAFYRERCEKAESALRDTLEPLIEALETHMGNTRLLRSQADNRGAEAICTKELADADAILDKALAMRDALLSDSSTPSTPQEEK